MVTSSYTDSGVQTLGRSELVFVGAAGQVNCVASVLLASMCTIESRPRWTLGASKRETLCHTCLEAKGRERLPFCLFERALSLYKCKEKSSQSLSSAAASKDQHASAASMGRPNVSAKC
jgi:hypothetical protein